MKINNEIVKPRIVLYFHTLTYSFLVSKYPGNRYNMNMTIDTKNATIKTMGAIKGIMIPV